MAQPHDILYLFLAKEMNICQHFKQKITYSAMKYILIVVLLIKLPSSIVSCKGCTELTLKGFEDNDKN